MPGSRGRRAAVERYTQGDDHAASPRLGRRSETHDGGGQCAPTGYIGLRSVLRLLSWVHSCRCCTPSAAILLQEILRTPGSRGYVAEPAGRVGHRATVRWREGTHKPLRSRFAAVRVRAAHRDYWSSENRTLTEQAPRLSHQTHDQDELGLKSDTYVSVSR